MDDGNIGRLGIEAVVLPADIHGHGGCEAIRFPWNSIYVKLRCIRGSASSREISNSW